MMFKKRKVSSINPTSVVGNSAKYMCDTSDDGAVNVYTSSVKTIMDCFINCWTTPRAK